MSLITAFESSSPKSEGEDARRHEVDYSVTLGALSIDLSGAEVAFSGCAKRQFLSALKDVPVKRMTSQEFAGQVPCWVMSVSVAMKVEPRAQCIDWAGQVEACRQTLDQLVLSAASFVFHHARPSGSILLIDALSVSIKEVGDQTFSFQLKQRWGRDE